MTTDLRTKLIQKGWVTEFNADTLTRLIEEHYAALADKPAVSSPTVMEIIELSSEIEAAGLGQVDFARAVLARWGNPAPQPPAEGEAGDRVAWLRRFAAVDWIADETADKLYAIADILSQHHPAPVPVSERLPGPEDFDEKGRCWCFGEGEDMVGWTLQQPSEFYYYSATHWLPAHALPVPEVK